MRSTCDDDNEQMGARGCVVHDKEVRDKNEYLSKHGRPDVAASSATRTCRPPKRPRQCHQTRRKQTRLGDCQGPGPTRSAAPRKPPRRQAGESASADLDIAGILPRHKDGQRTPTATKSKPIHAAEGGTEASGCKTGGARGAVKVQEAEIARREKRNERHSAQASGIERQPPSKTLAKRKAETDRRCRGSRVLDSRAGEAERRSIFKKGEPKRKAIERAKGRSIPGYNQEAVVDRLFTVCGHCQGHRQPLQVGDRSQSSRRAWGRTGGRSYTGDVENSAPVPHCSKSFGCRCPICAQKVRLIGTGAQTISPAAGGDVK